MESSRGITIAITCCAESCGGRCATVARSDLTEPFFNKLVAVLARTMGDVFPEVRARQRHVEEVLKREEEAFNKTLDKGIALFEAEAEQAVNGGISGAFAFRLYDEQGFPCPQLSLGSTPARRDEINAVFTLSKSLATCLAVVSHTTSRSSWS